MNTLYFCNYKKHCVNYNLTNGLIQLYFNQSIFLPNREMQIKTVFLIYYYYRYNILY